MGAVAEIRVVKINLSPFLQINELAGKAINEILQSGVKSNGAGGRYPGGWITYTLPDGRAASWGGDGKFIGFRGAQK